MTTVSIQVKDAAFAASIIQKYQRHRNVAQIFVTDSESELAPGHHANPGSPMNINSFLKKIRSAEKSKGTPWEKIKADLGKQ